LNITSRGFGEFFDAWGIALTPTTALPTPKIASTPYLTTSDSPSVLDWFDKRWCSFPYTPLTSCAAWHLAAAGHPGQRTAPGHPGPGQASQ
jgi:hypothetical protein